jgi:hypothetical protein
MSHLRRSSCRADRETAATCPKSLALLLISLELGAGLFSGGGCIFLAAISNAK